MSGPRVMLAILAVAILVGGFSAGRLIGQMLAGGPPSARPTPTASPTDIRIPREDRPGSDIPDLPRFPGAVRTQYGRESGTETALTTVVYAVRAGRNDVRAFYLDAFREHGWEIADLGFSLSTWTFVVERQPRQATVEISSGGEIAVIRLAVRQTLTNPTPEPTPQPTPEATQRPTPPTPAPPPDDDDDDDEDEEDDEDDEDDDDEPSEGDD